MGLLSKTWGLIPCANGSPLEMDESGDFIFADPQFNIFYGVTFQKSLAAESRIKTRMAICEGLHTVYHKCLE